jgi:hypothetical protein
LSFVVACFALFAYVPLDRHSEPSILIPAFLQPAADRAVFILPWVVSPGPSYGFLWAGSIIQIKVRKDNPTPAYSPVSDRRRLTALVEVHWARRVQAPMSQISGPNSQENHIIETGKEVVVIMVLLKLLQFFKPAGLTAFTFSLSLFVSFAFLK